MLGTNCPSLSVESKSKNMPACPLAGAGGGSVSEGDESIKLGIGVGKAI